MSSQSKTPEHTGRSGVLNYAFLTLVGKGDAKSDQPEILIIAAVPGFELKRLVHNGGRANHSPKAREHVLTVLGDNGNFIRMVLLAEDKVPGEIGHQTDVAGHAVFHSYANLTERSDFIIVNRIEREEFVLVSNVTEGVGDISLIVKLVERRATTNKADAAGNIRRKTPERETPGQRDQSASGEVRFRRQTQTFNAHTKILAPEIFHVGTAAEGVVPGE